MLQGEPGRQEQAIVHELDRIIQAEEPILLLASSGRGKSTPTACLLHAGFNHFSARVVPLAGAAFQVAPAPTSHFVKSTAWQMSTRVYPGLETLEGLVVAPRHWTMARPWWEASARRAALATARNVSGKLTVDPNRPPALPRKHLISNGPA
jgi:hypothetical protein